MPVPDEVPRLVKDHNSLVERVVAEVAILPAFGLATEIVRVKTAEPDHGRGVLGRSNGQTGRARDHDWHGEREGLRSSSVVDVEEEVGLEPEKGSGVKMRLKWDEPLLPFLSFHGLRPLVQRLCLFPRKLRL